ncbi:hypothetical protein N9C70_00460 [Flavobacteriales bacterium]|nr:hypothetical protein [Flavobacteriales bacterium]
MFKALRTTSTAAILIALAAPTSAMSSPQDLRDFDDFIHHVRTEAHSGDAERIMDCFAPMVVQEEGCDPVAIEDILGGEAQRFGWKATGRDVARFADGFVLIDIDGTMTNLHARAMGQSHLLDILGNRVKFRRNPGADGEVIAVLDQGTLPGQLDVGRWTVNRDGTSWTPVRLEHPELGKIKGYIGSDYVRPTNGHGDVKLTASFDGTRWALTGYERTRSDLVVNHDCPKP